MGFLYWDKYYFLLVVPMLILSLVAQVMVKSAFTKQSKVLSARGLTGEQAAARVLYHYGITDVRIERSPSGTLSDHFDPKSNVIRLSDGVYASTSVAAIGIACHEAGHAAQHAQGYVPIKIRNAILPVCNIGSKLGLPLAIIGYFLGFEPLVSVGLLLYALIAVFQFATLPVEFNASKRAIDVIEDTNMLGTEEIGGARKVLTAAAMTYVTALLVSLANLLRFVIRFSSRRNR
ncbi:MAG: zinc metallopeptidase [Clostridia bacterium]|nr:zinc metallopeptidase [Clostridia bacterium]